MVFWVRMRVLWRFWLARLHCQSARRLGHSKTWRGLRRFMESPLSFFRMHWDHEPSDRAVASWTAPVLWRFWLARLHCQSARGLAHSKTWRKFGRLWPKRQHLVWSPAFRRSGPAKAGTPNGRFMESPHDFLAAHWDDEPSGGCSAGVLACECSGRPARCSCWRRDTAPTRSRDGCATSRGVQF